MKEYTRQDIEDFINSLPKEHQKRARQMQWKIDQQLNQCKDDTQRFNKMVEIFWEGVDKFQKTLQDPSSVKNKQLPNNIVSIDKGSS